NMDALPGKWSVGVSQDIHRAQGLGCNHAPLALSGRSWTLRNQPLPDLWLSNTPENLALPPGSSATITVTLRGLGYAAWHPDPFAGLVRLTTNDPAHSVVDIPAMVVVGAPPVSLWFPMVGR
ncbi:MAG: hypothetical protein ACRDH2_12810, partial [Anaerolineales bacterium]